MPVKYILIILSSIALIGCANTITKAGKKVQISSTGILKKHDSTIHGYLEIPKKPGQFPTVILMHGCSGITDGVRRGLNNHVSYLVANGLPFSLWIASDLAKNMGVSFVKVKTNWAAHDSIVGMMLSMHWNFYSPRRK